MLRFLYIVLVFATASFAAAAAPEAADSAASDARQPVHSLREVVVTASESRQQTSASVIDSMAMKHLQPSSFTDLLELLPGNITKDPDMGSVNTISLRQAANISSTSPDYATSALGTLFLVDGMPLNTNSQLQTSPDQNQAQRINIGAGVDMRRLSTDDIEQVEIVRGIPSAEYGELTSGLVKIKRKSGISGIEARFKADNQSRLLYAGKGFAIGGNDHIFNVSLSWLDAMIDPRNKRENYKRLGATVRADIRFRSDIYTLHFNTALDYTGTFERDDNDPDLTVNNTIDEFKKQDHTFVWSNNLKFTPVGSMFFREASLTFGVNAAFELLSQRKHVASSRIMPLPVSTAAGSNYVGYLPLLYLSDYDVFGRPVSAYAKASTRFRYNTTTFDIQLNTGGEWNMSKNYGRGEVYDLQRPLVAGNNTRPRPFSAIPAMNQLSAYAETQLKYYPGNFTLGLNLGIRGTALVGMDRRYALSGKIYADPRITALCSFPSIEINGYNLHTELTAGFGEHTKMPVAAYLYPAPLYSDFEQLNYYHNNAEYRVMNVMTYIEDLANYDLLAARNLKKEIRADISYRGNRLSVTFFRETMDNGFRNAGDVHRYLYNKYDASNFDPYIAGHAPVIENLPYSQQSYQAVRSKITNGSSTRKSGVEFTLQSRRIPRLRTRLTVNGAWFRTDNSNSDPLWYKPSVVVGGKELSYIGLYDDRDGSRYESFNTNFLFDTDIPLLSLNFSIGVQNMWFTSRQSFSRDGVPTHYIGTDGIIHPFTKESLSDPYLTQLVRQYSVSAFDKITVPLSSTVNFKATKTFFRDKVGFALYVNRLFAIMPDYERYGVTMRRFTSPYFGMELNLKL